MKYQQNRIPLSLTYNRALPVIPKTVSISNQIDDSKNLQEIIGGHRVRQEKFLKKSAQTKRKIYVL